MEGIVAEARLARRLSPNGEKRDCATHSDVDTGRGGHLVGEELAGLDRDDFRHLLLSALLALPLLNEPPPRVRYSVGVDGIRRHGYLQCAPRADALVAFKQRLLDLNLGIRVSPVAQLHIHSTARGSPISGEGHVLYVDPFERVSGLLFHWLEQEASAVSWCLVAVEGGVGEGEYNGIGHNSPASVAALAVSEGAGVNVQRRSNARIYRAAACGNGARVFEGCVRDREDSEAVDGAALGIGPRSENARIGYCHLCRSSHISNGPLVCMHPCQSAPVD
mmetsp:Transcript_63823/g.201896  ORF Transcript_63823/g.201896 Transcript_63823/m.201896 type:complete len:277 (-) Transcript_63823:1552-2382(-)